MASTRSSDESAALNAAIIERYTTTIAAVNAIAVDLGCDHKYVRRVLLANGIPLIAKPRQEQRDRIAIDRRNQEIRANFEAGMSVPDIARQVGLSPEHTTNILIGQGLKQRQPQATLPTPEQSSVQRAAIMDRFLHTDLRLTQIADELGCTYARVQYVLRGIPRPAHRLRPKPKPKPPRVDKTLRNQQIAVLFDSGAGLAEHAERFNLTTQQVSRIAKEMGCTPRFVDGRNWQYDARNRQIVEARAAGERVSEIATPFGLSEAHIWETLGKAKSAAEA